MQKGTEPNRRRVALCGVSAAPARVPDASTLEPASALGRARTDAEGPVAIEREVLLAERAIREPEAFAELYTVYAPVVAAYLRRRWGLVDADDAVADAFAEAFVALPRYRGCGPLGAWLCAIATRRFSKALARERSEAGRRAAIAHGVQEHTDASADAADAGLSPDLRAAIGRLPTPQQDAVWLCLIHRLSTQQAASALGARSGAVKSRLARARHSLRDELHRLRERTDNG